VSGFPLTWMARALKENGLQVMAVKGWRRRGRPFSFDPRGVVFHHTASGRISGDAPSLAICTHGRSDLPGPLCHLMIGRDGTVYVIAAGRANHAGNGGPWRNIPLDSGNSYLIGVEVENNGLGEPWSDELLGVCEVVFATLLLGLKRDQSWLLGHKEWAPARKIDPGHIDMDGFRRRVRKVLIPLAAGQPVPEGIPEPAGRTETATFIGPADAATEMPSDADQPMEPVALEAGTYLVKRGDTLWSIAHRHGVKVGDLRDLNGLIGDLIHVGDRLRVSPKGQD
jgi:hypothetical protein